MIRSRGHAMFFWGTRIKCFDYGQPRRDRFLHMTNSIFQGDAFGAMWFCLALNPLSRTLNNTSYWYSIVRDKGRYQLTRLLYMDNLKLYAGSRTKLQKVLHIILQFSNDIGMEFGLKKCRKIPIECRTYPSVRLTCNWDMRMRLSSKRWPRRTPISI